MPKLLSARGAPVLAVVATPRFSAAAVIDGRPLSAADIHAWNIQRFRAVEEKCSFIEDQLVRLLRARRPGTAVIGIPLAENDRTRRMREHIVAVLRRKRLRIVVRPVRDTRSVILGRLRGTGPDALPKTIVRAFAPDLGCLLRRNRLAGYYWRNAFEAVALGIVCLAESAPQTAAALARPEAFESPAFAELVSRGLGRPATPAPTNPVETRVG